MSYLTIFLIVALTGALPGLLVYVAARLRHPEWWANPERSE